ncbi:hypothetical protein DWG20_09135 [Crenobacter cavernae]|uniref:Flagellar protein FliT n=2 Tax=Crenobacter cavernae TaxID=2290923 RepID=A0A345Y6P1_9NEIS|nr:hypothetical protein DWG20_09135 [Crenobacter cavernae]
MFSRKQEMACIKLLISEYEILLHSVIRERGKTGKEISKDESDLFDRLLSLEAVMKVAQDATNIALESSKPVSDDLYSLNISLKTDIESHLMQLRALETKFKNFNSSRVSEIEAELKKMQEKMGAISQIMANKSFQRTR